MFNATLVALGNPLLAYQMMSAISSVQLDQSDMFASLSRNTYFPTVSNSLGLDSSEGSFAIDCLGSVVSKMG